MARVRIIVFGIMALFASMQAQPAAILKGQIRTNELGGSPVPNVPIEADGANPRSSDSFGKFILEFSELNPGDMTSVSIVREGWAIVNDIEAVRELPSDPNRRPFVILISKASERQHWALLYYRLRGREVVDTEYRRRLQQLKAATAQERDRLQRERDQARAQADELARQTAEAKPTEIGTDLRRAQQLFFEGQVEQALQLLSAVRLKQQVELAQQALTQVVKGYILRGRLLMAKFQFDEAAVAFGEAVQLAPNDGDAQSAYAHFNLDQNRSELARQGYERALEIYSDLAKTNPETYLPAVGATLNVLGVIYIRQNRYDDARTAYENALPIQRDLAKINPDTYRQDLAGTLSNLGILYDRQERYDEAQAAFNEVLDIQRGLAKTNPDTYRPDLTTGTLNNLGILHVKQKRFDEAQAAFYEALGIQRELAKTNPKTHRPDLAGTLTNLGHLQYDRNRYAEARATFGEALEIYDELAAENPRRFEVERERVRDLIGDLPK